MIIGLGSDIVDVRRIAKTIERHGERFLDRIFTASERAKAERRANRVETYAKRFAAKEACAKALGTGLRARRVLARHGRGQMPSGAPDHALTGGALERLQAITPAGCEAQIDVSLTDEGPMAQAIVVISAVPAAANSTSERGKANSIRWLSGNSRRLRQAAQPLQGRGASARDERPMSVTSGTKRKEGGVAETVRVVIHALIIALVIRTFLFQPFNIPSGSMKATLLVGDYLFVSKYTYGYSHYSLPLSPPLFSGRIPGDWLPQRGDVVVFRLPRRTGHRLHQARDRAARRQDPGDRRPRLSSTACRSSASASRPSSTTRKAWTKRRSSAGRRRCRTA